MFYIYELVIGKCVGSEVISKMDYKDYQKRLNIVVKIIFDENKIPAKQHNKVKDVIYDSAQNEYATNKGYQVGWGMMERALNFGHPISNYTHKMAISEGCIGMKEQADMLLNTVISVGENKKSNRKKRNF